MLHRCRQVICRSSRCNSRVEFQFCKLGVGGSNPSTGSISLSYFREPIMLHKAELKSLVEEGLSIRQIATQLEVSYTTVRYWLRKYRLKTDVRAKAKKEMSPCLNCGNPVRCKPNQYCSTTCQYQFKRKCRIENDINSVSSRTLKKYLLDQRGHRCEACGITEWRGKPAPIELDHRDGNPENNSLANLRLICPNCHAQTGTCKGRNSGSGRYYRRKRYEQGKSY